MAMRQHPLGQIAHYHPNREMDAVSTLRNQRTLWGVADKKERGHKGPALVQQGGNVSFSRYKFRVKRDRTGHENPVSRRNKNRTRLWVSEIRTILYPPEFR